MRTLILSDLHLGNGGDYDIFAGTDNLPQLLDRFMDPPTQVILNGDSMDFLMNEDPLKLDIDRAVAQATAIATAGPSAPTFEALGRICAGGGNVIVRLGNHDIELALAEVQKVFRKHLNQPDAIAHRMIYQRGDKPLVLNVGQTPILITHGDQNDPFNMVDYDHLPGPGAPASARAQDFVYPPGSLLVKEILNPLKKEHGMRFADLLKPDVEGAVLTALAVDPDAVKVALKDETLQILRGVLGNLGTVVFAPGASRLGLSDRFEDAQLSPDEIHLLKQQLGAEPEAISFKIGSDLFNGLLDSLRLKLTRAGLKIYARMHREIADDSGERYFSYTPGEKEMDEAKRLAEKYGAKAVITGHSHAARWKEGKSLLYVNTGTWIWLMKLPNEDASDDEWLEYLMNIREDPELKTEKNQLKLKKCFNAVTLEPSTEGGARVSLYTWDPAGTLRTQAQATVRP
jgi:UDP-2,3-diacylglucosamine pyrophosphatase LpxH